MTMIRKIAVAIVGMVVIAGGVAMLFLPGPGLLTIVAGLAVLGSEFERPRLWMRSLRERASQTGDRSL